LLLLLLQIRCLALIASGRYFCIDTRLVNCTRQDTGSCIGSVICDFGSETNNGQLWVPCQCECKFISTFTLLWPSRLLKIPIGQLASINGYCLDQSPSSSIYIASVRFYYSPQGTMTGWLRIAIAIAVSTHDRCNSRHFGLETVSGDYFYRPNESEDHI